MDELHTLAADLGSALKQKGYMLTTAESCTGGLVGATITEIAGSSAWFERGFVTYSNQSKIDLLGVSPKTLEKFGAVSEQTAIEMAEGALKNSHADIAISITGIAGPDGGTPQKPIGTVCFAWAATNRATQAKTLLLHGTRQAIRQQAVVVALGYLMELVNT